MRAAGSSCVRQHVDRRVFRVKKIVAIEPAWIFYSEEKAWSNLDNSKEMSTFGKEDC